MIEVKVDESEVREICKQKIAEMIKEIDAEYVFWDTEELKRRTCMCWNTIQKTFFYDPRFPKHKVGSKWVFSARDTRRFLEIWLNEQPKN